jgi:hypothetical protein
VVLLREDLEGNPELVSVDIVKSLLRLVILQGRREAELLKGLEERLYMLVQR